MSIFVMGGLITINSKVNTLASIQSDNIKVFNSYIEQHPQQSADTAEIKLYITKLEQHLMNLNSKLKDGVENKEGVKGGK